MSGHTYQKKSIVAIPQRGFFALGLFSGTSAHRHKIRNCQY
jgi:hypothetical protein